MLNSLGKRRSLGFTLVELIATIGIMIATFSIVGVSAVEIKDNLEQNKADATARQIYIAAQENLTKLIASGNEDSLYDNEKTVESDKLPEGYKDEYMYVVSNNDESPTNLLIPKGTFDGGEEENTYIIEFDPFTGEIIGVFYTDVPKDPDNGTNLNFYNGNTQDGVNLLRKTSDERKDYVKNDEQKNSKYHIGYYGYGSEDIEKGTEKDFSTEVNISNTDNLEIEVLINVNKKSYRGKPLTTFITYEGLTSNAKFTRVISINSTDNSKTKFRFSEYLDCLTGKGFEELEDFKNFIPGENIEITAVTYLQAGDYSALGGSETAKEQAKQAAQDNAKAISTVGYDTFNTYFADLDGEGTNRNAYIAFTRHLRNLNKVDKNKDITINNIENFTVTKAYQTANIRVPKVYVNETGNKASVVFAPIENSNLTLYDGSENKFYISNLIVSADGATNAGLFGTFGKEITGLNEQTIKNLILIDSQNIGTATNAGSLIGHAWAGTNIENVGVQLSVDYAGTDKNPMDDLKVRGTNAGGLIGKAEGNLEIKNSYASTNVYGATAGGLVGITAGNTSNVDADAKIVSSYADCYISGGAVAGLIGNGTNYSISGCYASGAIIDAAAIGSGIANGNQHSISKSYTIFDVSAAVNKYSTVNVTSRAKNTNVFYISTMAEANAAAGTISISPDKLANSSEALATVTLGGAGFVYGTGDYSHPYNYRGFNLNAISYPYPIVSGLDHYGDWYVDSSNADDVAMFYWEYEEGSSNANKNGYHYYIVFGDKDDPNTEAVKDQFWNTTHDDGGVITEYGYGYAIKFNKYSDKSSVYWDASSVPTKDMQEGYTSREIDANINEGATQAMQSAFSTYGQYVIKAYKTADSKSNDVSKTGDLYMKATFEGNILNTDVSFIGSTHTTLGLTPTDSLQTYYYSFCPYFAADIVAEKDTRYDSKFKIFSQNWLNDIQQYFKNLSEYNSVYNTLKLQKIRAHQIRSIDQLQYLNYNHWTRNCHTQTTLTNFKFYPFLNTRSINPLGGYSNVINFDLSIYRQTHDIDASNYTDDSGNPLYTPIAAQSTFMNNATHTTVDVAIVSEIVDTPIQESSLYIFNWFGSEFDGDSYQIKNLSINSDANTVGLFGTTVGARLNNIIMTSNNGATISKRTSNGFVSEHISDYFLGGLVGLACDATGDAVMQAVDGIRGALNYSNANISTIINNCAIGGYNIVDNTRQATTLRGGAAVGGLAGSSTSRITNCSAVNNIKINSTSNYGICVVGGLVGSASGGEMPNAALAAIKLISQSFGAVSESTKNIIGQAAAVYNCYAGGSIEFSSGAKAVSGISDRFKGYYVGGVVGSNKNTNVHNVVKWDSAWCHSVAIFDCYSYVDLPKADSSDRIYSIGNIFSTCATPLWSTIYTNGYNVFNVLVDCYYYKQDPNTGDDYNFIEVEGYLEGEGLAALKEQVISICLNETLPMGNGVKPLTYNEMAVQRGNIETNITYNLDNSVASEPWNITNGDTYSYAFKPVVKVTNGTESRNGYIHVGEWPSATRITLKAGVRSGELKPIVGYIANDESATALEEYFKSKIKNNGCYNFGYYRNNSLFVNADGTFAVKDFYNSSKKWTYAPSKDTSNRINSLEGAAKWGYKIIFHSPYLKSPDTDDGKIKTVVIEKTSANFVPTKFDVEVYRPGLTADSKPFTCLGWFKLKTTVASLDKNGNVTGNVGYDDNGVAELYAGWKLNYDRIFIALDHGDLGEDFKAGNEYLIVGAKDGKYQQFVVGDQEYKRVNKGSTFKPDWVDEPTGIYETDFTDVALKTSTDSRTGKFITFIEDNNFTTWYYDGTNIKYGSYGYLCNTTDLYTAVGKVRISNNSYTDKRYNMIHLNSDDNVELSEKKILGAHVRHYLMINNKWHYISVNSNVDKFYVLKLHKNYDFITYDYN